MLPDDLSLNLRDVGSSKRGKPLGLKRVVMSLDPDEVEALDYLASKSGWSRPQIVKVAAIIGLLCIPRADSLIQEAWDYNQSLGPELDEAKARATYKVLENEMLRMISRLCAEGLEEKLQQKDG